MTLSPFIETLAFISCCEIPTNEGTGNIPSPVWVCKGKGCTRVREAGQSVLHLTALGERGLAEEQQGPMSSTGCVGSRLSQQCIHLFIYFKEETDGEEREGRTGETLSSLLGCVLFAGMIHPTPMQWYPVVCTHCATHHGRAAAEPGGCSSNPAALERVAPGWMMALSPFGYTISEVW